jgi:hypothetical protein
MKSNPTTSEDYRTIDVEDRVTIFTRKNSIQAFHDIRDDLLGASPLQQTSVTNYAAINLPHDSRLRNPYGVKSINNIIEDDKRYLANPQTQITYKCTCGEYSLRPVKNGLRHQSIIECKCVSCYAQVYIEIPFKKNQ